MQTFDAVFISDLHLHPKNPQITERFFKFLDWAHKSTCTIYILGDFFHAWAGDDSSDEWSESIRLRLAWLAKQGVKLYFMHGNRDFLLGKNFAALSGLKLLRDPCLISCGEEVLLLSHGDRLCTKDKKHQLFIRLTRNSWFVKFFLLLPLRLRLKLVSGLRSYSQAQRYDPIKMSVVNSTLIKLMQKYEVKTLIHGHTHTPGLIKHLIGKDTYNQYILSDWDDSPQILCYDNTKGLSFIQYSSEGFCHV